MSTDSATTEPKKEEATLQKIAHLGSSPLGESVALRRLDPESSDLPGITSPDPHESSPHFVMKKITKARLNSPEKFRQRFEALRRLDHPNLCPYQDLYVGERTVRITRDFVDGLPLDQYLLQPITDAESLELKHHSLSLEESSSHPTAPLPQESDDDTSSNAPEHNEEMPTDDLQQDSPPQATAHKTHDEAPEEPATTLSNRPQQPTPLADRPTTLEIPRAMLEDPNAADHAFDLIILRLRRLLPAIISALEYLHRFRRVHASLKPSNIVVTADDQPILTDYDLYPALRLNSPQPHPLDFRAPETLDDHYSPASDLYSLGAILFYALAGRPYGELRHPQTEHSPQATPRPLYLTEIVPHCPASWSDLIHGLLADDPQQRLTIDEVHRQLAGSEHRSVNIRASIVQERESLYGRQESLATLTEHATTCSQNRRLAMAFIKGQSGVGKTALVDALARWASQRGWIVLHGRCYHNEPIAYQGWEEIASALATVADELPEKLQRPMAQPRRRAALLFPQLDDHTHPRPDIDPPAAIAGFRSFLKALSQQRPLLICLDNLHWAGDDSIQLLADLATDPDQLRVMFVATIHHDEDPERLSLLQSELSTAPTEPLTLLLKGFSKSEARQYILKNAAHLTLPQKQQVLRRGGFNPLLIDELIHDMSDLADAHDHITAPDYDSPPQHDEQDLPDKPDVDQRLRALVEHRMADLTRSERLALQLLAVATGPLSADLLEEALKEKVGAQTQALRCGEKITQSLIQKRLVRPVRWLTPSQQEQPRFTVIHDLCREAIKEEIGQDHHGRLCGIIADALGEQDDPDHELRFEYLRRAGRDEEATHAAEQAAESALRRFAFHRATDLLRWLSKQRPLTLEERHQFAQSLLATGDFTAAQTILQELLTQADPADHLHLRYLELQALLANGERTQAIASLDTALKALDNAYLHHSPLTRISAHRQGFSAALGRTADITTIANDSTPSPTLLTKAQLLRFALDTAPLLHSASTPYLIQRFGSLANKTRFAPLLAQDRLHTTGLPWTPFLFRPSKYADRRLDQARQIFIQRSDLLGEATWAESRAYLCRHSGDLSQAQQFARQALELLDQSGRSDALLHTRLSCFLIDAALISGAPQEAEHMLKSLSHHVRRHQWLNALVNLSRCDRDLLTGDLRAAQACLDQIGALIGEDRNCLLHLAVMDRRTQINIALGRPEVAVAQWDLLLAQIYTRSLRRLPAAQLTILQSLTTALISLLHRKLTLKEPRRRTLWRRLNHCLRRLSDLKPWMGAQDQAHLHRLYARVELLRRRPQKALKHARRAIDSCSPEHTPSLINAMNLETLGVVLERLEEPEARTTLDQSYQLYDTQGVFLPLVLQGWPVPTSHSQLQDDPP